MNKSVLVPLPEEPRIGKRGRLVTTLLLALAVGCSGGLVTLGSPSSPLTASGVIEAREVSITAEVGGRIVNILADEGDEVEEGAILVRLDTALLETEMGRAQAAVALAQANLAQVKAGAREEEIGAAQAALEKAIAAQEGAKRAWEDAQAVLEEPQELNLQIAEAETQLALAEHQLSQAQAQLATAQIMRDKYERDGSAEGQALYEAYGYQVLAAEAALAAAQEQLAGAQKNLENLLALKENPISLQTRVHAAQAQCEVTGAAAEVAQAALESLKAGATPEEIAAAQAQLEQAEAALGLLEVQLEKMTLKAPLSGLVSSRSVQIGETASPGAVLLTLADLDQVELTVFIPENRLGEVHLGQKVTVEVDSFPGKVYQGEVVHISSEAEFTPRNVQTKEERVNTVFAVKVRLPNPAHELKPGMPADATFEQ
jgi:HlyD family secretion protein